MISNELIRKARRVYSALDLLNPGDEIFNRIDAILDRADDATLLQLAEAKINFISAQARSRMVRRGLI